MWCAGGLSQLLLARAVLSPAFCLMKRWNVPLVRCSSNVIGQWILVEFLSVGRSIGLPSHGQGRRLGFGARSQVGLITSALGKWMLGSTLNLGRRALSLKARGVFCDLISNRNKAQKSPTCRRRLPAGGALLLLLFPPRCMCMCMCIVGVESSTCMQHHEKSAVLIKK